MSQLTVYKASAGSGKTFRLALEYIKLVLAQPNAYRHILAVTFTNKATAEMKNRILNELHTLANNTDKSNMFRVLQEETGRDANDIKERAKQALTNILHDYSMFSVSTIDSFVQRVIRSLLWELEVHSSADIKIDHEPYVERAVERLMDECRNDKTLFDYLKKMLQSNLDDDKTPKIDDSLIELGKELFKEQYRLLSREERDKMADRSTIEDIIKKNKEAIEKFENDIHSMANEMLKIMKNNELDADSFSQKGKGVGGFPQKCIKSKANDIISDQKFINSYHEDAYKDSNKWFSGNKINPKQSIVDIELYPIFVKLIDYINNNKSSIITHLAVQKNISTLWLISGIRQKIKELCNEDNSMLLADSGPTLREFVGNDDTPFVFEKVGIRFNHIMLDEFQDTSQIQWDNFKPLLENSLGQGYQSLVVGDVKQAIYRWRNSDWQILGRSIEEEFDVDKKNLDTNYRSRKNIVEFNNQIFSKIAEKLPTWAAEQDKKKASHWGKLALPVFDNPTQKTKHSNGGYVEVQRVQSEKANIHLKYLEQQLPELVHSLLQRGYRPGDIAILVRKHDEGQKAAKILISNGISIVSQDAMTLSASCAVRLCVAAMSYIYDNDNTIALGEMMRESYLITHPNIEPNWDAAFDKIAFIEQYGAFLNSQQHRPIGQIFEAIVERFDLDKQSNQLPYIAALHEQIIKLPHEGTISLENFIKWWKEAGHKHKLALPDNEQSVNIVTIHKAKGLEYPVVIMPFANIKIFGNHTNKIWTPINVDFYNNYPLYLIELDNIVKDSTLSDLYTEDRIQTMIDAMNMLYVALTRPEQELYMMLNVTEKAKEDISHVEQWIWPVVQDICGNCNVKTVLIDKNADNNPNEDVEQVFVSTCTIGEQQHPNQKEKPQNNEWTLKTYTVSNTPPPIAAKLSTGAIFGQATAQQAAERGNIMHRLYSLIETKTDISKALDTLQFDGMITIDERKEMEPQLQQQMQHEPYSDWFSGKFEVINERNIIIPGEQYCPDRVMLAPDRAIVVDYKFGNNYRPLKHTRQVQKYMQLIEEMHQCSVEGYVWYITQNRLRRITPITIESPKINRNEIKMLYQNMDEIVDLLLDNNIPFSHDGATELTNENDQVIACAAMIIDNPKIAISPFCDNDRKVFEEHGYMVISKEEFSIDMIKKSL